MSLEEDLLNDLDSDFESSDEQQPEQTEQTDTDNTNNERDEADRNAGKDAVMNDYTPVDLDKVQLDEVQDITRYSSLHTKIQPVLEKIDGYLSAYVSKAEESQFLTTVNSLSIETTNEINVIHNFIKLRYHKRYPELESLIPNPLEYARLVQVLGNDLTLKEDSLSFLSKEKVLVLTMSTMQAQKTGKDLTSTEIEQINKASGLLLSLSEYKTKLSQYVSSRLIVLAPNLTAIVGPTAAAQFITILGGLEGLAKTPACNIPSLGSKLTVGLGLGRSGMVNEGYLFFSDIIQDAPSDLRKQAMRITAGKIILAARIDLSSSIPDGSQGLKWRKEIENKIEKLGEPPENVKVKALPMPIDQPAKKRGGRRYRKQKARFELSELRKAQNIMEFGKKESTITDSFGEEIGLGITGSLSKIPINVNNRAKVSKVMKQRLDKTKVTKLSEDIFNQDFINLPKPKENN